MEGNGPPRRKRRPRGPPYSLLFLGLGLAFWGVHAESQVLIGIGAALAGLCLLVGYARSPGRPPPRA